MAKQVKEIKTFDDRKKELIEEGQKKGFITFEELANALKGLEMDADSLDSLYNDLVSAGINVVTEEEAASSEGGQAKSEEVVILDDEDIVKDVNINDPVRIFQFFIYFVFFRQLFDFFYYSYIIIINKF